MSEHHFELITVDFCAPDAADQITRSLRDTGFAVISNHPVSITDIEQSYSGWRTFFASDDKTAFRVDPPQQDGFFPFRSENAKGASAKDLKEFYHVYPDGRVPADLETDTRGLFDQLVALGRTVLGWIDENSPASVRTGYTEPLPSMVSGSRMNMLRVLHYPPLDATNAADAEPGAVRAAAHEDINLITLLVAGSAPGLQALDSDGIWHHVPCDPGTITINVGDMLQMASGGYFPSTTHRVVNPAHAENTSRYSMPMFLHPRPEVVLNDHYSADDYLQQRLQEIGLK